MQKRRLTPEKMPATSLKGQRFYVNLVFATHHLKFEMHHDIFVIFLLFPKSDVTLHCVCVLVCVCRYLQRFDSELEQIELVNGIKGRQGRLHGAREAVIKQTIERERAQYEGVGFGESSSSKHIHTHVYVKHAQKFKILNNPVCFSLLRDPRHHKCKTSENIQVSGRTV